MAELPQGTVTLLFSDIEGSTRLLARERERYVEILLRHRDVLRAAFAAQGGTEVGSAGDGLFTAFPRARAAVAAAVAGQRALASARWPDGVEVRVRMGVHTGEAAVVGGGYVGLDVHRAARICSAGHGGQVLVSAATRDLVLDTLPPDVVLRDMGHHALEDLERPEHLFQVVTADLDAAFPPLRTATGAPIAGAGALPAVPNRTIGRDEDVRAIAERLCRGVTRLLTLTGPGGVGKTRLATEAARAVDAAFPDGARFVALADLRRPDEVAAAIVRTLGVVPLRGETGEAAVARYLGTKRLLLVLDNFEHVLPAARLVASLLGACPTLSLLTTSREPLGLQAEECYPVAPLGLALADAGEREAARAGAPAVALFVDRAAARDPGFALGEDNAAAVAAICRRVDGLPLAIELAAARTGLLSPVELAERLDGVLGTVGTGARDAPDRHRTLRATIDWSHELLGEAERRAFARFAVFAGGATVDAAEAITTADAETLERLVAKSLLVRRDEPGGRTRLAMLETIRVYAVERLRGDPEREAVHERHYRHCLALAQRHGSDRALFGSDRREHLAGLDREVPNAQAALRRAFEQPGAERALALVVAMGRYWLMRDRYAEAVDSIDRALDTPGADRHPELGVRALCLKAWCLWPMGRGDDQAAVLDEAEALARRVEDRLLVFATLQVRSSLEAGAGRLDRADGFADEALRLATCARDEWAIALAAHAKARAAVGAEEIRERVDWAAPLLNRAGNVYALAGLLASSAYGALMVGSDDDAVDFIRRATPVVKRVGSPYMQMVTAGNAGLAALLTGDVDAACDDLCQELELCRETVVLPIASEGLFGLAAVAVSRGDLEHAARLTGAAARHRYGHPLDPVNARLDALFFAPARARLGSATWDAAARDGAGLTFEDAIAHALDGAR